MRLCGCIVRNYLQQVEASSLGATFVRLEAGSMVPAAAATALCVLCNVNAGGINMLPHVLETIGVCVKLAGSDMNGLAYWLSSVVHILYGLQHANHMPADCMVDAIGVQKCSSVEG
jgi:hypothetical protein